MVTVGENDTLAACLKVLQANWTRLIQSILHTDVILFHRQLVADIAAVAVVASLSPTYFANSALIAVIDFFLLIFIVVKCAYVAIVGTKVHMAALTGLWLGLNELTTTTFDVCYWMPVDFMIFLDVEHVLVHFLIMAEATRIRGSFANRVWAL